MGVKDFCSLLGAAASGWVEDNALRLSAALAYYALFSLAPLMVIVLGLAGLVFGHAAAQGRIADQLGQLAGSRAANAIQALVLGTSHKSYSATLIGLAVLLFGASGAFCELKAALNTIWGVQMKPGRALTAMVRERFISFAMVLGAGLLLLASLIVSAALSALGASMHSFVAIPAIVWQGTDIVVSFAVVTLLFAMIFKVVPNVTLTWRDLWIGAACTAFLFTIGKLVIALYLGTSGVASYYGAAGSAVVILLWVYYSATILFFGAEFTKAYVLKHATGILPDKRAILQPKALPGKIQPSASAR